MNNNPRIEKMVAISPKIDSKLWLKEPELAATKWFDYRMDDPVTATEKFAQSYLETFKHFHERYRDHDEAELKRPLKSTVLTELEATVVTGLWKARQKADEFGIPYDKYIYKAFEALYSRGYKKFPRPNQLYSEPVIEAVEAFMKGATKPSFNSVCDERYLSENFRNSVSQEELASTIIDSYTSSEYASINATNLSIAIFDQNILPRHIAKEALPESLYELVLEDAQECGRIPRMPSTDFSEHDFDLSCFAVPHNDGNREKCIACPLKQRCEEGRHHIEQQTKDRFGSTDPKLELKREKDRLRQQKRRAKLKAAAEQN